MRLPGDYIAVAGQASRQSFRSYPSRSLASRFVGSNVSGSTNITVAILASDGLIDGEFSVAETSDCGKNVGAGRGCDRGDGQVPSGRFPSVRKVIRVVVGGGPDFRERVARQGILDRWYCPRKEPFEVPFQEPLAPVVRFDSVTGLAHSCRRQSPLFLSNVFLGIQKCRHWRSSGRPRVPGCLGWRFRSCRSFRKVRKDSNRSSLS